jgi:hypothetical protein
VDRNALQKRRPSAAPQWPIGHCLSNIIASTPSGATKITSSLAGSVALPFSLGKVEEAKKAAE